MSEFTEVYTCTTGSCDEYHGAHVEIYADRTANRLYNKANVVGSLFDTIATSRRPFYDVFADLSYYGLA